MIRSIDFFGQDMESWHCIAKIKDLRNVGHKGVLCLLFVSGRPLVSVLFLGDYFAFKSPIGHRLEYQIGIIALHGNEIESSSSRQ
jgi:hypothetical protein